MKHTTNILNTPLSFCAYGYSRHQLTLQNCYTLFCVLICAQHNTLHMSCIDILNIAIVRLEATPYTNPVYRIFDSSKIKLAQKKHIGHRLPHLLQPHHLYTILIQSITPIYISYTIYTYNNIVLCAYIISYVCCDNVLMSYDILFHSHHRCQCLRKEVMRAC